MTKNQIIGSLILVIGISSCKKDIVQYPITYSSDLITESSIKAYTKNGEISSPVTIKSIVNRYQSYFTKLENEEVAGKIIATYLSEDSVELTINHVKEEKLRSVHEDAGVIYWEKQDTSMSGLGPIFRIEDLYKYHPYYYYEYNAPPGSGYLRHFKYKECHYVIRNGKKLNIPMIEFVWILQGYNKGIKYSGINNSFSKEGLARLFVGDTILVQQYSVEMK